MIDNLIQWFLRNNKDFSAENNRADCQYGDETRECACAEQLRPLQYTPSSRLYIRPSGKDFDSFPNTISDSEPNGLANLEHVRLFIL